MATSARIRRSSFNMITWVYIAVAVIMGGILPSIEKVLPPTWVSPISKPTIEAILGATAAGMITLSGLVFSLVFVLVQFGSSTYSPRITAVFSNSFTLRHSLGIFTGTFLFALLALRDIGIRQSQRVNDLPIWIATLWLLASIVVLMKLIRVFSSMTITNMLPFLGSIARRSISRNYGAYSPGTKDTVEADSGRKREPQGYAVQEVVYDGEPVYIRGINSPVLVSLARASDSVIVIPYMVGDAVPVGLPLASISGKNSAVEESRILGAIELGYERSLMNDPKFPLRLLVDIGIRALSPGINDPTTAVQSLDQIEPLLQRIGNSDLDTGVFRDRDGVIRLIVNVPTWEDYLQLSLCEMMQYGASSLQVERRLEALLSYLLDSVPPDRGEVVRKFWEQRRSMASESFENKTFHQWADIADREGVGSGIGGADESSTI